MPKISDVAAKPPTGYVAQCRCGSNVGALDLVRTDPGTAGGVFRDWIRKGLTMRPKFGSEWSVGLAACRCAEGPSPDPQADTQRLEKLMRELPGSAVRKVLGVMSDTGDLDEFRRLIDTRL